MNSPDELPPDGLAAQVVPPGAADHPWFADEVPVTDAWQRSRILVIRVGIAFFLLAPFLSASRPSPAQAALIAPATIALIVIANRFVIGARTSLHGRAAWAFMAVTVGLAVCILAVGDLNWIGSIFVAGAAAGRISDSRPLAMVGAFVCAAGALGVGLAHGINYGNGLELTLGPLMAAFFAYTALRRMELVGKLSQTRAELARMAVADERLRIARDLHDLLGHSLSLITLKAELAGRLIEADPDRAAREVADMESVARRSLGEVRAAVTGYRQPSLAAELAAARQMLAAAGLEAVVRAPEVTELAPDTEALLAWTVREGTTNVVRHSGARGATITISVAADEATAEVADDGVGPGWDAGQPRPAELGSGLAGLAERARAAGAEISAGEGQGGKGFRLRVRVPARRLSAPR
jgi:two-component system, NarL family, sensor histidine kinase DesK